jgi:hypothetical protein
MKNQEYFARVFRSHFAVSLLGIALTVFAFAMMWAAKHLGVGIDQTFDQQSFLNMLERVTGPNRFGSYPYEEAYRPVEESYGFTFQALAFAVSLVISPLLGRSFDPLSIATFTDKNVLVLIVAMIAVWALYHLALSLTRRRFTAATAATALVLIPAFSGHALMNQKDIPLAAGMTCFTAGAVMFINQMRTSSAHSLTDTGEVSRGHGAPWMISLLLALGIMFGVGSRPTVAVIFAGVMVLMGVIAWWYRDNWAANGSQDRLIVTSVIALSLGGVVVLITNPASLPNPVGWLMNAIEQTRNFSFWSGSVLVRGELIPHDAQPRWYLPFMLFIQTPVVILLSATVGAVHLLYRAITVTGDRAGRLMMWTPVLAQVSLAVAGVAGGSLFYNAARQALFVLPIIALLAGIGFVAIFDLLRATRAQRLAVALLAVLVAMPIIDSVRLFPYQYVYVNELERSGRVVSRYEFDYWGISGREAMDWVNQNNPDAALRHVPIWVYPQFAGDDAVIVDPLFDQRLDSWKNQFSGRRVVSDWDEVPDRPRLWVGNYYPSWGSDIFTDCPIVHTVTRPLWNQNIPLSLIRRCPSG